jgi:hypothetical protein
MPQGLTGLSGLATVQILENEQSQATPEQRSGDPADPRHQYRGQQARPYPWESRMVQAGGHGPYGLDNQLLSSPFEEWALTPAGDESQDPTMDRTPSRRAAPWPKGIASGPVPSDGPDDIANQLAQSYEIHGTNMNASAKMILDSQGWAVQDDWREYGDERQGNTLQKPLPKQAVSSGFMWGTRDRVQSMARQNEHGFDAAHVHRRYAQGSIPGNNYWMRPGGRLLYKTLAGPARPPIGPDSPFEGQDLGASFDPYGALLMAQPTEYVAPPQVSLAPPVATPSGAVVEWY